MKEQIGRSIGFFRATALGGLLFLLPVAVIIGILGYVYISAPRSTFPVPLTDPAMIVSWSPVTSSKTPAVGSSSVEIEVLVLRVKSP